MTPNRDEYSTVTLLISVLAFTFLFSVPQIKAQELILMVDDYPPYIDKSEANQGFWSEIVIAAFNRVGIKAKLQYKPWARVSLEINRANAISFGYLKDEKRSKKWLFSDVIASTQGGFLAKKSRKLTWATYQDLIPYRIGRTIGYSFGDEFQKWESQLKIEDVPEDIQNIQKILANRTDLFVTETASAAGLIRQHFDKEQRDSLAFIKGPALAADATVHLVCAKSFDKCAQYVDKFNLGLKQISKEGLKQKIIKKIYSFN